MLIARACALCKHQRMSKHGLLAIALGGLLVLASCGGSGGGGTPDPDDGGGGNPEPSFETGTLSPVPVSGLNYSTPTESETTDASGEFRYNAGDIVEFRLGDTVLGSVRAAREISLFELQAAQPLHEVRAILAALADPDSSFTAATNLVRLLYTLDDDQSLENGVTISADVAALFSSVALNFNRTPARFAYSQNVQNLLGAANRRLMPLEVSLAHQYEAAGILLIVDGVAVARIARSETTSADGDVITVLDSTTFTYDELGSLARREDLDAEEQLVSRTMFDYDAQALRTREATDSDGDGQFDTEKDLRRNEAGDVTQITAQSGEALADQSVVAIRYNELGQEIERTRDQDGDGAVESILTTGYATNGRAARIALDADADGSVDQVITNVYDTDERLSEQTFEGSGIDDHDLRDGNPPPIGEGVIERFDPIRPYWGTEAVFVGPVPAPASSGLRHTTFLRDAQGRVTERRTDRNGDGKAEQVAKLVFGDGRPTAWQYDADGDGISESEATYAYSSDGTLESVEETLATPSGPAVSTRMIETGEDGPGRRFIRISTTSNALGPPAGEVTYILTDDGGRQVSQSFSGQEDSTVTTWDGSYRLDDSRRFSRSATAVGAYRFEYRDIGEPSIQDAAGVVIASLQDRDTWDVSLHFEGLTATYTARLILNRLSREPPGFDIFYREPQESCRSLETSTPLVPANDDGSRPERAYYRRGDNRVYIPDPAAAAVPVQPQSGYSARDTICALANLTEVAELFYPLVPTDLIIEYPLTIDGIEDEIEPNFDVID